MEAGFGVGLGLRNGNTRIVDIGEQVRRRHDLGWIAANTFAFSPKQIA
jgi:hypothetical protein